MTLSPVVPLITNNYSAVAATIPLMLKLETTTYMVNLDVTPSSVVMAMTTSREVLAPTP